ncbi:MAG: hypothetical protein BWY31_01372 [Lentisphaerae bacterium ADurb.Bin242]|nr:MAG: hypothetical protein BWY31_01372 [Lentisphaerae bacterium ADurb.Bin242]
MKMKKAIIYSMALVASIMVTGCATPLPLGVIYTKVTLPGALGNSELQYSKTGTAKCYSIIGVVASGDASINAACHNAGITKVSWVSYSVDNILGAYGVYTTTVYGD